MSIHTEDVLQTIDPNCLSDTTTYYNKRELEEQGMVVDVIYIYILKDV